MVTGPITRQQLENAAIDAQTIEKVSNDDITPGIVVSRLGRQIKTLARVIDDLANKDIGTSAAAFINQRIDQLNTLLATQTSSLGTLKAIVDTLQDIIWITDNKDHALDIVDRTDFIIASLFNTGLLSINALKLKNESDIIDNIFIDNLKSKLTGLTDILITNDNKNNALDITDKMGFIIATFFVNSMLSINSILLGKSEYPIESSKNSISLEDALGFQAISLDNNKINLWKTEITPTVDNSISIIDKLGFIIFYIGENGVINIGNNKPSITEIPPIAYPIGHQLNTDIKHILCYGQSLSIGAQAVPSISTIQPYSNIMIHSGVRSKPGDGSYDKSNFAPLIETDAGTSGETPVSGCLNGLTRRVVELGHNASQFVLFGSATGSGGKTVQYLSPGGSIELFWERTVQLIKDVKSLSDSQAKTYSVWAMIWYQGENNNSTTFSKFNGTYEYTEYWLTRLWQEMRYEVYKITGQKFAPYMCSYQVAAHRRYSTDTMHVALAQWRAQRIYDDVILAMPAYILKTYSGDHLHLTNESSWLMGEYTGRALFQTMIQRSSKWRPLEPVKIDWENTTIVITYHVPSGKIVIDDKLCTTYPNAGFIIRNGSDQVISDAITNVAVTGNNEITITTSATVPTDAILTYARGKPGDPAESGALTGARGNVRDTHGVTDKVTSPLGNVFELHNASVMFEYSRKYGF